MTIGGRMRSLGDRSISSSSTAHLKNGRMARYQMLTVAGRDPRPADR